MRKIRGMYGARGNFAERAECGTEDVFCRRGGKMLDFVSWLCLNSITMDKWAPAVAGAFLFAYPGLSFGGAGFFVSISGRSREASGCFFTEEILCMI